MDNQQTAYPADLREEKDEPPVRPPDRAARASSGKAELASKMEAANPAAASPVQSDMIIVPITITFSTIPPRKRPELWDPNDDIRRMLAASAYLPVQA